MSAVGGAVPVPATDDDGRLRLIAGVALFALAAITAIVSYLHALTVVRSVGNTGAVAYLVPFVADLMIVSASMALLEAARNSAAKPALAIVSLVFGIGATLAMNVAAGWHHGSAGALVAALPPLALILSLETLMGLVRRSRERSARPILARPGQDLASAPTEWP